MRKEIFKSLRTITEESNLVAREAMLAHKADKRTIKKILVLIEGIDDKPVYSVFLDDGKVDFKDCNGCLNVEKQHNTLKKEHSSTFLSILDSDFKRMESKLEHDKNLFYTDYHDSEMQMLCNKKVQKRTIKRITKKAGYEDIVLMAERELYNVSMLKWYNSKRNLRYRFEAMDLVNLSKGSELSVNIVLQYITPTNKSSKRFPRKSFEKFLSLNNIRNDNEMLHHLTNGHDIISRMSGIMKLKYKCQISERKLRDTICESFTLDVAKKSKLYNDLKKWCDSKNVSIIK